MDQNNKATEKALADLNKDILLKYLRSISKDAAAYIRIGCHKDLSRAECFYLYFYIDALKSKVPFYFSMSEINRIEGDFAEIIGRTPWGPWCLCRLYRCSIYQTKILNEDSYKTRLNNLLDYIKDFEDKHKDQ